MDAESFDRYLALRHLKRRECLGAGTNILCPCGKIIQVPEEIDPHLDHMIEADAAKRANGLET